MPGFGPLGARAATIRPTQDTDTYGVQTYFQDCSSASAADGTVPTASWFNHISQQFVYAAGQAGVAITNDQSSAQDDVLWDVINAAIDAKIGTTTPPWGL